MSGSQTTPVELALQNACVVHKILEHTSSDLMGQLRLRLVNKTFNLELLRRIRRSHRSIELSCTEIHRGSEEEMKAECIFYVNDRRIKVPNASNYFKFLIQIAKVQVEELKVVDSDIMAKVAKRQLHRAIVNQLLRNQNPKILLGMSVICGPECDKCARFAFGCDEFGPIQLTSLMNLCDGRKHHFRKLVVSESLLHTIAVLSTQLADSKEECLAMMRTLINPNITCDRLCLIFRDNNDDSPLPLPREVLDGMCGIWQAKCITIRFEFPLKEDQIDEGCWTGGYFTEFQFKDPFENTPRGVGHFEELKIVAKTEGVVKAILGCAEDQVYENMIPNARRVFPTDRILIPLIYQCEYTHNPFDQQCLHGFLKCVWEDNDNPKLHVTIRHLPSTDDHLDFDIPQSFSVMGTWMTSTLLPAFVYWKDTTMSSDSCTGRTFRITDRTTGCTVDLELLVENDAIQQVLVESEGPIETGWLRHLIRYPRGCTEYGPLGIGVLRDAIRENCHYKELHVSQELLNEIAMYSANGAQSKEHCMRIMRSLINRHINCDHLRFIIHEFFYRDMHYQLPSETLPYEIIVEMCRVWKVKSATLEFDYTPSQPTFPETWSFSRFFTEFRFNGPPSTTPETIGLWLDEVRIDVRNASTACFEILGRSSCESTPHYNNLIANARRVLPTGSILVDGSQDANRFEVGRLTDERFLCILNTALKEYDDRGLTVIFRHYPNVSGGTIRPLFKPPASFSFLGRDFVFASLKNRPYDALSKEFYGKMITIFGTFSNFVLKLEILIPHVQVEMLRANRSNNHHVVD